MTLPALTISGDLPVGAHPTTLTEVLEVFANATLQRRQVGARLKRLYELVASTDGVKRFIVFGSFITRKPDPNDIDVFLVMHNEFDIGALTGEARLAFDHAIAQAHFGVSVFWLRQLAALPDEEHAIANWAIKRDGSVRGLVEIIGV